MGYGVGWGAELGRLRVTGPSSACRWRRTASTACTACNTGPPAPSTSTRAASSCVRTSPRAATSSSPPPSSQATLASSCSESSPTCPPTAGARGLPQGQGGWAKVHTRPAWRLRPRDAQRLPQAWSPGSSLPADASTHLLPLPSPALLFQPLLAT